MAFDIYANTQSESSSDRPKVDYDALNRYVVETANLTQRETLVGYVAGIVDIGTQEMEDAEIVFTGSPEDEAAEIEKHPNTYFEDGIDQKTKKPCRMKRWPQKPQQSVVLAVDFPDIMLNKGQFFGDEDAEEKPLRLWMGGQFYMKDVGMVVGRPIPLKVTNIAPEGTKKPVWSFAPNHQLYKMALGAKLIQPGEAFHPRDIDKLIGVSLQFEAQVFFKSNKGKEYYTEYLAYKTGLGRGQVAHELVDAPFLVQFNQANKEEDLKNLRAHVVNTIRRASNFEGSAIQKQLDEVRPATQEQREEQQESTPAQVKEPNKESAPAAPKPKKVPPKPVADDFSEDVPFNCEV